MGSYSKRYLHSPLYKPKKICDRNFWTSCRFFFILLFGKKGVYWKVLSCLSSYISWSFPEVHYRPYISPPLVTILSKVYSLQELQPTSSLSILISSHLQFGLPKGLFSSGLPTKTVCISGLSMRATCSVHISLLDLRFRFILGEIDSGGPMVIILATGSEVAGSNPTAVDGFFQSVQILSMTSFGRDVKPWVLCRRFTARKRTWNRN